MFSKSKRGPLFKKCSKPKVRPRPKPNYREPPPINYPMYKEPKPYKYEESQDRERISSQENTPRPSSSEVRQSLYRSRSETTKLNGDPSGSDSGYGGCSVSPNEDSLSLNAEDENGNAGHFSFSHREGGEHLRCSSSARYSRSSETLGEDDEVILEEDEVFLERDESVYSRSSSTTSPKHREFEEHSGHRANTQMTSRGENASLVNEPKKGRFVKQMSGKPNPRNPKHLLSAKPPFSKANHILSLSKSDGDLNAKARPLDQDSSFSDPLTSWRSCSALDSSNKKVRNNSVGPTNEEEEDDEVFPLHHSSSSSAMERRKSVSFELPVEREIATYPPETMEDPWRYKDRGSRSSSFRKSWTKRLSKLSFTGKKSKSSSSGTSPSPTPTSSPMPFLKRKIFDFETLSLRSADSSHLSEYTGKFSSLKLNLERKKSSFPVEPTLTGFVHDNTEFPLRCSGNYENDSCSVASFVSIESSASKLDTSPKITKYPLRKKCIYEVSPTEDVKFKLPTKPKRKGPIKVIKSLIGGSSKSTLDLSSLEKASDSGLSRSYDDILKENNFPTQEEYLVDPRMFTLSTDMMDLGDFDDDDDYYRSARYSSKKDRHDTDYGKVTRRDSDSNHLCGNSVSDGSFVNEMEQSFDIIRDRTLRKVSSKEPAEDQEEMASTPRRKNSVHNMVTKFEELERRFSQASIKKQPLVSNKVKVMHFSKTESDQNIPLQGSTNQPTSDCQNEEIYRVDIKTSRSTPILPSRDAVMETKSGDETSRGKVTRKKLSISHSVLPRERSSERRPPPPRPPIPVERKIKSRVPSDLSKDKKNNLERSKSVPALNTDSSIHISKITQNFEETDDGREIKKECTDLVTNEKQNEECKVEIETSLREFQGCFQESQDKSNEGEAVVEGLSTPDIRVETTSPLSAMEVDKLNISSYHLTVQKSSSISSYEDFDKCSVGSTSSVDRLSPRVRRPKARKIPPKRPPPPKIPLERLHSYAQRAPKGDLTGVRVDAPLPDQPAPPKPPRLFHILSGHKKDFKNSDSLGSTKYRRFSVVDSEYDMIVAISPGVGELSSENESAISQATDIDMDETTYKRYPIDDSDEDLRMCGLKSKRYSSHLFQLSNSTADTECDAVEEERFSSAGCEHSQDVDESVSSTNGGHDQTSVADRAAFFESCSVRERISIKQELDDDGDSTREVHTRERRETCWTKNTYDSNHPVGETHPIKKENPINDLQDIADAEEDVEERSLSNFPTNKPNPAFSKRDSLESTPWLAEGEARCIAIIPGPGSTSENEEASPREPRHKQSSDESQTGNASEKDEVVSAGDESCLKKANNDIETSEDDSSHYESANSDSESTSTYGEPTTMKENKSEKPKPPFRMSQPLPVPRREVFGNEINRFAPNTSDLNSAGCSESSLVPVKRTVIPMQIQSEKNLVKTQESQESLSVDTEETGKPLRPRLQEPHGDSPEARRPLGERPQESRAAPLAVPRETGPTSRPVLHVSQEAPLAAPREVGPSFRPRLQDPQEPRETSPSPGPRSLAFAPNAPPRSPSVTPRPSSVLSCPDRPLLSLFFERLLETQQIASVVRSDSNSPEYECKSRDGIGDDNKSTNEDNELCSEKSQNDKTDIKISARPRLLRSNHELKTLSTITDEQFSVSEEQTCMEKPSGESSSPKNPEEAVGSVRTSVGDEGKYFKPISPSPPPRSLLNVQVVLPQSSSPSPPPPPSVPPPVFTRTMKDEIIEIITFKEEEKDVDVEGTTDVPIEHKEICKDDVAYITKDETAKINTIQDLRFEGQKFVKSRPVEIPKRTRRRKMHKVRNEAKNNDDDDSEGEIRRPPRPKPRRRLLRADAVQGSSTSSATSTSSSTTSTSSTEDEEGQAKHVKDRNLPCSAKEDSKGYNTPLDSVEATPDDTTTMVVEESLSLPSVGISVRRASDSLLSLPLDQPKLRKSSCDLTPDKGYSEDAKEEFKVT